jgi:hypothetical protein
MNDANASPAPADTPPIPLRYWWLKRILLMVGLLVLALAALRWWWGHEAERRLQAKIDEYHALGQPVTVEDFQFPPVPDGDNAAHFLMEAAATLVRPSLEDAVAEDLHSYPEGVADHADALTRWIAANTETLRLVREARGKSGSEWGIRYTSPMINILLAHLSPQRALAKFLCATALLQHHNGDDASAVQTLQDAFFQAETIGRKQGFLISYLVAIATDALAVNTVEAIAPALRVAREDAPAPPDSSPTSRAQVHALIAGLLDETALRDSWRWAMWGERLSGLDSTTTVATTPGGLGALGGPALPNPLGPLLKPMFQLDAIFIMELCSAYAEAGLSTDYHQAMRTAPAFPAFESSIERSAHMLSRMLLPSFERAAQMHFLELTSRRLAATALAIRLYEIDRGHRPHSLDELVPGYLPAIPTDPFCPDRTPIGYRPDADPPVLYSVGTDGVDDGGEFAVTNSGNVDLNSKDWVFFLDGDRPRPLPPSLATQPAGAEAVEGEGD